MKIQITLKYLKTTNNQINKGLIKVHIGDYLKVQSAEQIAHNNVFYFMEKNMTQVDFALPNYVSFDFIVQKKYLARKSLFFNQAIEKNQVILNPINTQDKNTFTLSYQLKIIEIEKNIDGSQSYVPIKTKQKIKLEEQSQPNLDQTGKLQFFKLGKLSFLFAKMLDPMVKITNKIKLIFSWQRPELTILFGIILTLIVLFPKLSIIAVSLCLFFGRTYIITAIQNSRLKYDISKRLLPPQQNLQFLCDSMQLYCDIFQNISYFLQQDDKTKIITIVQIICKGGILLSIISLIFSLENLLVIWIWSALLMTTAPGKRIWYILWPHIVHYNRLADKALKNVAKSSVAQVLGSPDGTVKIYKQFYIYENQRWWLGKQWVSQYYSNQSKKQKLYARSQPPRGWKWIDNWQAQHTSNTDADGFQYANDLVPNYYTSSSALKTIRRRKWKRICMKASVLQKIKAQNANQFEIQTQKQNEVRFYSPHVSSKKQKQI